MLIVLSYLRCFIVFVNARPEIIVVGLVSFLGSEARPFAKGIFVDVKVVATKVGIIIELRPRDAVLLITHSQETADRQNCFCCLSTALLDQYVIYVADVFPAAIKDGCTFDAITRNNSGIFFCLSMHFATPLLKHTRLPESTSRTGRCYGKKCLRLNVDPELVAPVRQDVQQVG